MTTARPIEEIENDELIYLDVDVFDNETLLREQERCQEVIDQHVMAGGIDLTYWYDRVNHIEQVRSLQRVYHTVVRRDNKKEE